MRLLIMGPQGVGKGTQAALLSEHYGIPAISTGDIFRYNIKNKTELGVEALKYIDKGELVPDELTNKIVKDRLAMDDAKNGWILDGYPRNASQVEALDAILGELDTPLDAVVALDADHRPEYQSHQNAVHSGTGAPRCHCRRTAGTFAVCRLGWFGGCL